MSTLPFNLASSHFTAEQVYDLHRGTQASHWDSMKDSTRGRWEFLASWINERTALQYDVTQRVMELLGKGRPLAFTTPNPTPEELERIDGIKAGTNIHDDDIAAAAQRFLREHDAKSEDASSAFKKILGTTITEERPVAEDKPARPTTIEVIDALADTLKRLLG